MKTLLEKHPNVTHATVNLTTETALVKVLVKKGTKASQQAEVQRIGEQLAQVGGVERICCLPKCGLLSLLCSFASSWHRCGSSHRCVDSAVRWFPVLLFIYLWL